MNIQNIDLFEMHEPLTGSFPFAAMTAVLPDDISSVSIHWQDTMEILLIREGTGRVSIDLEKISIKKGDICLILPGQLHSIDADSNSSLKISMIQFPLSLLSGSTDNDDAFAFLKPLSEGEQVIPWLITPEDGWYNEFRQCFEEMFQLQTFYSAAYPLGIRRRVAASLPRRAPPVPRRVRLGHHVRLHPDAERAARPAGWRDGV